MSWDVSTRSRATMLCLHGFAYVFDLTEFPGINVIHGFTPTCAVTLLYLLP